MLPLADAAPLSPEIQLAIASLLGFCLMVLGIYSYLRRTPSLDTDLTTFRLAIDGLKTAVDSLTEITREHDTHTSKIEDLQQKVSALEEKHAEGERAQREYTRKSTLDIFQAIDSLKNSFNHNIQLVERALGKLEGGMEGIDNRVSRLEDREK